MAAEQAKSGAGIFFACSRFGPRRTRSPVRTSRESAVVCRRFRRSPGPRKGGSTRRSRASSGSACDGRCAHRPERQRLYSCRPVLDNLGQQTFVVGTDPGQANLIKLLGNVMTATALEMLGEVVALVLRRGLDPKPVIDFLTSTMFGGRVHRIYGDKIVSQSYAPGFVMPLALKDVRLATCRGRKCRHSDAVGQRGAGPADHGNRPRLCRSRLDCARPHRCRGSGSPRCPSSRRQLKQNEGNDHVSSSRHSRSQHGSLPRFPAHCSRPVEAHRTLLEIASPGGPPGNVCDYQISIH
jgi:hypothetical protein